MLMKAGSGLAGLSSASSEGISARIQEETLISPLDDEKTLCKILEREAKDIACIIIEPLPAIMVFCHKKRVSHENHRIIT